MPDSGGTNLLLTMGLDLSPVRAAADTIKTTLNNLNDLSNQVAASATSAASSQGAAMKQLATSAQASVVAAKEAIAQENAKAATLKTQTAELIRQQQEQKNLVAASMAGVAASKEKLAAAQAETAQLKTQTAELQRQAAVQRLASMQRGTASKGGGGGSTVGALGGLGGNVAKGLLGEGLAGSMAGGLLAGAGYVALIQLAGTAIEGFLDKLRDTVLEAGKLTVLENVFKQLAAEHGIEDSAQFMDQLNTATKGLVGSMTLLRDANIMLQAPGKLTQDQMVDLSAAVTKLSLDAGKTAEQGMEELARGLQRGNLGILSMTLNIPSLRQAMYSLPPGLSAAERASRLLAIQIKAIEDAAASAPEPVLTLDQMMTRLANTWSTVEERFGQGLSDSAGMKKIVDDLGGLDGVLESVEERAAGLGSALGNFVTAVLPGFQGLYQLGKDLGNIVLTIVNDFTKMFGVTVSGSTVAKGALTILLTTLNEMMTPLDFILRLVQGIIGTAQAGLPVMQAVLQTALAAFYLQTGQITKALAAQKQAFAIMKEAGTTTADAWKTAFGGFADEVSQRFKDLDASINAMFKSKTLSDIMDQLTEQSDLEYASRHAKPPPDPREAARRQQDLTQEGIAQAKLRLEMKKDEIAQTKAMEQEAFATGHEALAAHYAAEQQIIQDSYDAEMEVAKEEYTAQAALARVQYAGDQERLQTHLATLQATRERAEEQADNARKLAMQKQQDEQEKDQQEATQRAIQGHLKQQENLISQQTKGAQAQLQQGEMTPDEYFAKQIELTEQLADARIEAANKEFQNSSDKVAALQTRTNAINEAIDDAQAKMEQLSEQQAQIRLQFVERQFQPQQQVITDQIGSLQPGQNPAGLQQQMLDLLQQEREVLEQQITSLPAYSDGWYQVLGRMEQVYQTQQKYNDELRKSSDLLQPIADGLDSINKLVGTIWTSHFVKGLTAGMQGGIDALKNATQAGTTLRNVIHPGSASVPKDPQMAALEAAATSGARSFTTVRTTADRMATALAAGTAAVLKFADTLTGATAKGDQKTGPGSGLMSLGAGQGATGPLSVNVLNPSQMAELQGGMGAASVAAPTAAAVQGGPAAAGGGAAASGAAGAAPDTGLLTRFSTGLVAAVGELTNFATALSKSSSAVGGAMSGAAGGAGIGQTVSSALNMTGPWGMIAGAVAGTVLGAITGQKNAEMSSEMSQLNATYTSIMDAFQANTNNLQEAIVQMQALMEEAEVDEANSKKGGSAFASLVTQYSQQLDQLSNQQRSVVSDMETQLAIFSTPTGMQSFLTNLNQIIDTYDKFAGAAENASQLAQANSWLTDSLSSYTTQMENTFVQDEEQGINDALSLNSLISDRSTLISNLNDSIMAVLEQGVLTRQQTTAQTKGQQIEQLETQGSSQLTSIDQEISLEQYKVAIETSLYNLAMTSMGLQAQLLSLQEGQASQSLAAIAALQELIQALQSGSYNFGSISAILTALGYGNAAGSIPSNTTTNPNGPVGAMVGEMPSTNAMDALIAAAYQSRATLGYATFRGQNL